MAAPTGHELLVLAERLVSAAERMKIALEVGGMTTNEASDEVDRRIDALLASIRADVRLEVERLLANAEVWLQRMRDGL